jgi:mono/diheme cytochrome c family protein
MFQNVCSQCHGLGGMGDGPAAESLSPKPRNYSDAAWQASVTDDEIRKIILEGGQAVGKSPMMPAQGQLRGKPEVVDALVTIIRGFGAKK